MRIRQLLCSVSVVSLIATCDRAPAQQVQEARQLIEVAQDQDAFQWPRLIRLHQPKRNQLRGEEARLFLQLRPDIDARIAQRTLALRLSRGRLRLSMRIPMPDDGNPAAEENGVIDSVRQMLEKNTVAVIQKLERATVLSEEQKRKLVLAGRGDAHQLVRQIKRWNASFLQESITNQEQLAYANSELRRLNQRLDEQMRGRGSLLEKVLCEVFSDEQKAQLAEQHLDWFSGVVRKAVGLTQQQRAQLLELLMEHAGTATSSADSYRFGSRVLLGVDQEELGELLDSKQLPAIERLRNYYETQAKSDLKRRGR